MMSTKYHAITIHMNRNEEKKTIQTKNKKLIVTSKKLTRVFV